MKKILSFVLGCLLAVSVSAQQVNTLYFLENSPHRHYLNPALTPISNMYLSLPVLGYTSLSVGNNSLALSDLVYTLNGQTVTFLHPDVKDGTSKFLKSLRNSTLMDVDMNITLLSFGARTKRNGYWHVTLNERIEGGVSLPKGLFNFVLGGGMTNLMGSNYYDLKQLGLNASVYTELGVGYTHALKNEQWTIGGKVKFLYGHAYAGMYNKNFDLNASKDEWSLRGNGYAMIAAPVTGLPASLNFGEEELNVGIPSNILDMLKPQGLGAAIDFGVTYKPHEMVQIAASITDLGFIVWNKGMRYDYAIEGTYDGVGELRAEDYYDDNSDVFNSDKLVDTITTRLEEVYSTALSSKDGKKGFTRMTTPRLNIGVDANFWENRVGVGIYSQTKLVNARLYEEVTLGAAFRPAHWFQIAASYSFVNGKWSNIGAALGLVTYEGIGLTLAADYIPCSYANYVNETSDFSVPYKTKGINLALGLNIVIGHAQDKDRDGVKNKFDLCPETPKSVVVDEFGCPIDTDGDGVADYLDECPNTPSAAYGFVDERGCPLDTDVDGVPDYLDECPGTPTAAHGYIDERGCPMDTDGDGVPDYLDKCPGTPIEARGYVDEHGCLLDTDGDGVPDYLDECPNTPEAAYNYIDEKGCPVDTDGDGVFDYMDECPNTPAEARGYIDEKGCELDTDSDGVADWCDNCPTVAGLKENKGCPVVKREIRNLLKKAMQGIQFETGKAIIKPKSYGILNDIASTFIANPTYIVEVQGHTDDVGKDDMNMDLSDRRANAVRDYLIKQGVPADQLTAKGYGETMPIADNKTKAGRALNRRVEFAITFEEVKYEEVKYTSDSTSTVSLLPDSIPAVPVDSVAAPADSTSIVK